MRFNPKARLDRGRVQDTGQGRGSGGMGGAGMRLPTPGGVGGGIGGIIVVVIVVVAMLAGVNIPGLGGSEYSTSRLSDATDTGRYENCKTGEDANNSQDCARVAVENSLTDYWGDELGGDFQAE